MEFVICYTAMSDSATKISSVLKWNESDLKTPIISTNIMFLDIIHCPVYT
jgi:hypothetical protein